MVKTIHKDSLQTEQKPEATVLRSYELEEFEADTTEERPVAVLAQRRRQFLAGLKVQQTGSDASADK